MFSHKMLSWLPLTASEKNQIGKGSSCIGREEMGGIQVEEL